MNEMFWDPSPALLSFFFFLWVHDVVRKRARDALRLVLGGETSVQDFFFFWRRIKLNNPYTLFPNELFFESTLPKWLVRLKVLLHSTQLGSASACSSKGFIWWSSSVMVSKPLGSPPTTYSCYINEARQHPATEKCLQALKRERERGSLF